ncbi:MAG: hypothetical protein WCG45_03445, partial [bacterium]
DYGNIKSEKKLQQDLEYLKEAYENKLITKYEYDKSYNEIKEQIIFRKEFIESAFISSKYFVSKKSISITSLIPSILKEKYDEISKLIKKDKNISTSPIQTSNKDKFETKIKSEKLLFQATQEDRISHYKTLIRESFAKKKSIFFVLPTENDISTFYEFLSVGIENFSFKIHGGMTAKKQFENIKNIIENSHPVIVLATAPYLSISRYDFETIILEHESSNAYRMIASPYFDLRIFIEIYASKINAKFILADSLISFETIARKELDNIGEISPLSFKINFKGKIEIPAQLIEDLGEIKNVKKKEFEVLKDQSIKEIQNIINKKENVFIFSLRKGLASITICRDCNQEVLCEECLAPLVLYLSRDNKKRMFICNRCKIEKDTEVRCKNCESWNLMPLGIGTDTVFLDVNKKFPNVKIFKLDKESAKTAKEALKIIKDFSDTHGSILIGTEMALFYLKEKLPLTVIASFDSLFSIPNYKINERVIQLLTSIISKTKNKIIIQTKNERDPAILAIKTENLLSFIREELKDRENIGYPPYKTFIKITYLGDKEETTKTRHAVAEVFKEYNPVIFSGFVAKLKGKYRTNALIKVNRNDWSIPELSNNSNIDQNLFEKLSSLPQTFTVNINPEDLL